MTSSDKQHNLSLLWVITIAMMIALGIADSVRGVVMPDIRDEFGINQEMVGRLTSIPLIGYMVFCFLSGILIPRVGLKRSLAGGFFIMAASFALMMKANSYLTVFLLLSGISAACGFFEVGTNSLAAAITGPKAAASLNFIHFFYGVGAIAGPQLAFWFKPSATVPGSPEHWRDVFYYLAFPLAVFIIITLTTTFPKTPTEDGKSAFGVMRAVLSDRLCWLMAIAMGLLMGIELGTKDWLPFYLRDCYQLAPEHYLSAFYVFFSISRLAGGWLLEKTGYARGLLLLLAITFFIYLAAFILGGAGVYLLPATGVTIALMFPTVVAVAVREYPTRTAAVIAFIVTGGGLLTGVISWLTGLLNHMLGSEWGYRFFIVYVLAAMLTVAGIRRFSTYDKTTAAPAPDAARGD